MIVGNNRSHLGTDTIKLTASKIVTTLVGLVSSMLLSRFRSLTEYGTYSQLLMVINLVSSFIMLGLPNSLNYFVAKADSEEERSKFLSVYYTVSTILSFIVGLVLVVSIPLIEKILKNDLIKYFWFFLAFFPWTRIIMSGVENLLVVYNKTNIITIYRTFNSVALLSIIIFVQLIKGTFVLYMVLYVGVEGLFTIWTYILAKQNAKTLKPCIDWSLLKKIFSFSIPIGVASMIGTLNIELDKLVINAFFTVDELAIYTNASRELPVTIIATSITAVLLPQLVKFIKENKTNEAVELWGVATTISFSIICFVSAACVVFAPEIITILYSDKYIAGSTVFRVYSLTLLFKATYYGIILNATGKTRFILYSSIGTLCLNIGLNYAFYYMFGFVGPAWATFAASAIMNTCQLFCTAKICNISFWRIYPWLKSILIVVLNVVLGGISLIIHNNIKQSISPVISAILVGLVWLLVELAVLFRPIKKEWKILNS